MPTYFENHAILYQGELVYETHKNVIGVWCRVGAISYRV